MIKRRPPSPHHHHPAATPPTHDFMNSSKSQPASQSHRFTCTADVDGQSQAKGENTAGLAGPTLNKRYLGLSPPPARAAESLRTTYIRRGGEGSPLGGLEDGKNTGSWGSTKHAWLAGPEVDKHEAVELGGPDGHQS